MVFKLVRTDTAEPCKIQLPLGKHLIGRGKLLDCEDKRVSRNHGELEITYDKVVMKALHQNPCFIIKKGIAETQILKQNCVSDISNGDKFGLLPDSYWYELLHCVDIDNETESKSLDAEMQNDQGNDEALASIDTEPIDSGNGDGNDDSQLLDLNLNDTIENDIPGSPSLLGAGEDQTTQEIGAQSPTINSALQNEHSDKRTDCEDQDANEPNSPSKRCHSPGDGQIVKKIKTESDIKQDPDAPQAGPSNDGTDSNSDDNKDQKPVQQVQPNPALRERCMYGAGCYRRNPQHKAQFSHPTDSDWGAGPTAPCPWGAACTKQDPRHWRDHNHPPGTVQPSAAPQHQPPPNVAGKKKRAPKPKRRFTSDQDESDDDTPAPGLIVQGKRARKTVTRTDAWSDSESEKEEDPYGTDESDEWQPSSDVTDSQLYSQIV